MAQRYFFLYNHQILGPSIWLKPQVTCPGCSHMPPQPLHHNVGKVGLLARRESPPLGYAMPLQQARAAATARGVLRNERWKHAMTHRCLPAIVAYDGRSQPARDGFGRSLPYLIPAFARDVGLVGRIEVEAAPELRLCQPAEQGIKPAVGLCCGSLTHGFRGLARRVLRGRHLLVRKQAQLNGSTSLFFFHSHFLRQGTNYAAHAPRVWLKEPCGTRLAMHQPTYKDSAKKSKRQIGQHLFHAR